MTGGWLVPFERLLFRVHAIQRMFERQINVDDVREVLISGEVIEDYPDDSPYPSYIKLGWRHSRPIHVVAADNKSTKETIIITVYEPNLSNWKPGFKRRLP
jgi:hypothetical protein